jgi:putative flippase GtrA
MIRVLSGLNALVRMLEATGLSERFVRFGLVGILGLCWDTGTVYALRDLTGLYVAGTCGFLVAATANWCLNRIWTFGDRVHETHHTQWAKFIVANSAGFAINRGCFFILISINSYCFEHPVYPVIAGSISGLGANYLLSKRFVFR